ncbi:MAG: uracil phosphoribosyltransferase [Bacteroidota bacterium]
MDARITILGSNPSYINNLLRELRDEKIQADRMRFRSNMERVGMLMAYELSKELSYESQEITTPLGTLAMDLLAEQPVLVSILRAGLPFHQGFLKLFDNADNGFISAYRHHTRGNEFIVKVEYLAIPDITNRTLILVDPMIATGQSLVLSYKEVVEAAGKPEKVIICGVVASEEGIEYLTRSIPNCQVYVLAVDKELTAKAYIVPGLGDAGDLAFGPK